MGRRPEFKPRKYASGYRIYVPGQGIVDLGTTDENEARTRANVYAQDYATKKGSTPKVETPKPQSAPSGADMIQTWKQSPNFSTPQSVQSPVSPSPSVSASPSSTPPSSPISSPVQGTVVPTVQARVEAAMPQDRRKKVADLLAGVATRLNVVAVAASVKLLGRAPATEEDEDAEAALKEGWSLQLEELFVDHPPAPWMIILGGSAAIGLGMYTNGTPIQKKPLLSPPGGDVDPESEPGTGA